MAGQLDLFGWVPPPPAKKEVVYVGVDLIKMPYFLSSNEILLRRDNRNARDNTAELRLLVQVDNLKRCTLDACEQALNDWMKATSAGNHCNYWHLYKLVRTQPDTLQLWHTTSEGNPDRHVCSIIQFREPTEYVNPIDLL